MCRSKTVHEVEALNNSSYEDGDFFIGVVNDVSDINDEISVQLLVEESDSIKVKLDTGAQVNVMSVQVYNSLKTKSKVLQPTKVKLTAYGGNRISVLGTCQLKCKYKKEAHNLEFYVVNATAPTALSLKTCQDLSLLITVLDATAGYWNVPLSKEASILTTFQTPIGRFCYLRMPFGICSAQEVFQNRMDRVFGELPGVHVIVDDILVSGSTREDHDERLRAALTAARRNGVKFNPKKIEKCSSEVKFFGELITKDGLKLDPSKVAAVGNMMSPQNKKELESPLGMFTYLAQYSPHLLEKTAILRELVKKDTHWNWCPEHEASFTEMQNIITQVPGPVLKFYETGKHATVQLDASQSGLEAVLLQDGKPVAYASKALTPTQQAYAQIEKEALALVFGCEKFHHYLYGRDAVTSMLKQTTNL